jgi:hypothetical protein
MPRNFTHEKELRLQETKGKERKGLKSLLESKWVLLINQNKEGKNCHSSQDFFHAKSPTMQNPQSVIFLLTLLLLLVSVVFFSVRVGASEPGAFRTRWSFGSFGEDDNSANSTLESTLHASLAFSTRGSLGRLRRVDGVGNNSNAEWTAHSIPN